MDNRKTSWAVIAGIALGIGAPLCADYSPSADNVATNGAPAADNTAVNKNERAAGSPTADQASNAKSDVEIMRQIRRGIVEDKSLSTYAHNVKIIAKAGKVTLKGPVRTEGEKTTIEAAAANVAGAENVVSEISIRPAKKS